MGKDRWLPDAEYLRECFSYDPETGALTWKQRPLNHFPHAQAHSDWNKRFPGQEAGSSDGEYIRVGINNGRYRAHRVIWVMLTGKWPKYIDHKNLNGVDNRLLNLREATFSENRWNTNRARARELPRGVYRNYRGRRFAARAVVNGREIHLGSFDTPEEAHAAWLAAVREERGEFLRAD